MRRAIELAKQAEILGEVPVGAVLIYQDKVLGEGYNQSIQLHDPSAHAEIVALRKGGQALSNYRLLNTVLYVTLEPCLMCIASMVQARISRLVFGAFDPKAGVVTSCLDGLSLPFLNHRVIWEGGVLKQECVQLLQEFFKQRRK